MRLAAVELPRELRGATDIRWASESSVIVGVRDQGIYLWDLGKRTARRVARSPSPPYDHGRIGYSAEGTVFSGILFGFYRLIEGQPSLEGGFELVGDLDRRGATSLVVGLSRDPSAANRGPYGEYIAWLVPDDGEPQGLIPTMDRGRGLDWCVGAELPVGRFVTDDRIVIVPGAEPGAFVYDLEGKVVATLSLAALGVDEGCRIQREQMFALSTPDYATAWLNERAIVDEIVGDGEGAFWLFVRTVDKSRAKPLCWDLVAMRLGKTDEMERTPCVLATENLEARLRADLHEGRLLLLVSQGEAEIFLGTLEGRGEGNLNAADGG